MSLGLMDFVIDAKSRIKEVDVIIAEELIAQGYKVLDVREPSEHNQLAIENSINVPRGVLEPAADLQYPKANPELRDSRDSKWLVLCATGGRGALAADILQKMGFSNVSNISGGMLAWVDAGKDTVTPIDNPYT
ncbi:MAG: rhodanese-like domain-containing protein [Thiotrichaceae bacterium]|nr:rhodanese-like domain-containing protein [Thiotrichaceae bacterium]